VGSLDLVGAASDRQVERRSGLLVTARAGQELGPHRRQPVPVGKGGVEPLEQVQPGLRPGELRHRDGPVQPDDG
jgi:hypothetical protein